MNRFRCCWTLLLLLSFSIVLSASASASASVSEPVQEQEPLATPPDSPRLTALLQAMSRDDAAEAGFWREVTREGAPLVERVPGGPSDTVLVTFLWRQPPGGGDPGIAIAAWLRNLMPESGGRYDSQLQRLGDSGVWYRSYRMPAQGRFPYFLVRAQGEQPDPRALFRQHDASRGLRHEFFQDPLNPRARPYLEHITHGPITGGMSYVGGPDAPPDVYALAPPAQRGEVKHYEVPSKVMEETRRIAVYTPPGYDPADAARHGVLLVFDGMAYLHTVDLPMLLDRLHAQHAIAPLLAVMLDSAGRRGRGQDLPPDSLLSRFLDEELWPWLHQHYAFSDDPTRAVVAGASLGGLAAANTAFSLPHRFGNVLSQSGSYWWWPSPYAGAALTASDDGWTIRRFADQPQRPLRFYQEVGTWENPVMPLTNRRMRDTLRARGYAPCYSEFEGGHDLLAWGNTFSQGLVALVGQPPMREETRRRVCQN